MTYRIPVARPALAGNERRYVLECLESGWISSVGQYVERFEAAFAAACGTQYALSCVNGTAALHLALLALGVGPGDEVIVPTFTFVATANAVRYCGATPVLADAEPGIWTMDPVRLETLITPRTRGIVAVHIYGHPADMDPIRVLAARHGLFVVEDAAEAFGAEYYGRRAGALGDVATFSFYGNKILTTGEGGMVVTDDAGLAERIRLLKGQGMDPIRRYWFPVLGYNYRMTNIEAAIGLAQLERADWHLAERRRVAAAYRQRLGNAPGLRLQDERPWARSVHWMNSVLLTAEHARGREALIDALTASGIETRPLFIPMHRLPMYHDESNVAVRYPIAEELMEGGFNVPTYAGMTESDIDIVCDAVLDCLSNLQL